MSSNINLYREYLSEEEKFLKLLERNFQDQINRLKVEELSVLKLISCTGENEASYETDPSSLLGTEEEDEDDLTLAQINRNKILRETNYKTEQSSINSLPLDLDTTSVKPSFQKVENESESDSGMDTTLTNKTNIDTSNTANPSSQEDDNESESDYSMEATLTNKKNVMSKYLSSTIDDNNIDNISCDEINSISLNLGVTPVKVEEKSFEDNTINNEEEEEEEEEETDDEDILIM